MMSTIATLWKRFAESVAVVAFAAMFAAFIVQIASRYLFNSPISWTLEVCLIAYVWVVFWSSDILVKEREHIVFDVLFNMAPPAVRRWFAVFVTLSLVLVFAAALPGTADYIAFLGRRRSTVLHVPMPVVFGGFLVFVVAVVVSGLIRLRRLLRPGWQDQV